MWKKLKFAYFIWKNPQVLDELYNLVDIMYRWTKYRNTNWSIRAKKVLDGKREESEELALIKNCLKRNGK